MISERPEFMRMAWVAALLMGGCTMHTPTVECDLAVLVLHDETRPKRSLTLSDGSLVIGPGFNEKRLAKSRLMEKGIGAINELFRLGETNPRLTGVALGVIGEILLDKHQGPFQIEKEKGSADYWVIRWNTGEGLSRADSDAIVLERDRAITAFRTWLYAHGYLVR
jgi:hypothetical protein